MKRSDGESPSAAQKKYVGVRRRKWGKWVSEIRVPATRTRLWLGSYRTPEAAAIAHDTAVFCLHGPPSINDLNFPSWLPATARTDMSPDSIQQVAAAAGMDADARLTIGGFAEHVDTSIGESSYSASGDDARNWAMHHMATDAGGHFAAESVAERREVHVAGSSVGEDANKDSETGGQAWSLFMDNTTNSLK